MHDAFAKGENKVEYHDYYKYRISYITEKEHELMFLFVTGLTDNFENIKKELIKCKKEFLNLFEDILHHKFDAKTFEIFDPIIDSVHRNLRPKISLVGFSGVGKTTITRLIKAEEIPIEHIPTITGDIATIKIGKLHFHLWDFAGQEQFSYLWNNFIKGSDAVLLITDSTLVNVEKSKFFLELIKEQAPQAHTSVIGNKQDLADAMKPEQIEKILGLKVYSMVAKDQGNRDKMITIIADILEMSAEVSPLLQPLLERDTYTEKALRALEDAKFDEAASFFEKISDLCIELGDDSLGKEFYEKSQKIKSMILKTTNTQEIAVEGPKIVNAASKVVIAPKLKEEPSITKKIPTIATPKVEILEKPKIDRAIPPLSGPPEKIDAIKKETLEEIPAKPLEQKVLTEPKIATEVGTHSNSNGIKQTEIRNEEKSSESDILIKPKIQKMNIGLSLDPKEFMVKQRPKTVTNVPKDAKNKLKTSPFGHVSNPAEFKKPIPVSPTELVKTKPPSSVAPPSESKKLKSQIAPYIPNIKSTGLDKVPNKPPISVSPKTSIEPTKQFVAAKPIKAPSSIEPPIITHKIEKSQIASPTWTIDTRQEAEIENSLIDLRIKKAGITKMSLDFDMKELTGEITIDELKAKKQKLKIIEANIDKQIQDLEKLLKR